MNSIHVNWNTAGSKYLHSVEIVEDLPVKIFDGSLSVDDKDGDAIYNGSWTIDPGINTLRMTFTKSGIPLNEMTLTFAEGGCGPLEKH